MPVSYEVAGLGSRFLASLIDHILFLGLAMIAVAAAAAASALSPPIARFLSRWSLAIFASSVLVYIAFFAAFEIAWNGQTPGKRAGGLRVIRADGTAPTPTDILLRNLLRIVDFLPAYYGIGLLCILITRRAQRLGDLAAGTVVIRYLPTPPPAPEAPPPTDDRLAALISAVASLPPGQRRAAVEFVQRRDELDPRVRGRLARQIAAGLRASLPSFSLPDDPEQCIELIAAAVQAAEQRAGP